MHVAPAVAAIIPVLSLPVALALAVWSAAGAQAVRQGLHLDILSPPAVARHEDGDRLAYEIHATNFAAVPLKLAQVRIVDADSRTAISTLDGASLIAAVAVAGRREPNDLVVPPGARAIVYVDAAVPRAPRRIRHSIEFDSPTEPTVPRSRVEGELTVSDRREAILGPPLKGGPWVAVYDPQLERGHRRVVYATDGRARIPGRFAIDWMKPGNAAADGSGAAVLAVADAVVVHARKDMPARTLDQRAVPLADATGNFVTLDLGEGQYVFYEHLQPGVLVEPGQRVRRGQVIGSVGASGHATAPHLHLHVSDAPSSLGAEGLPFRIADTQIVGGYPSLTAVFGGQAPAPRIHPSPLGAFFPSPNLVVFFPQD